MSEIRNRKTNDKKISLKANMEVEIKGIKENIGRKLYNSNNTAFKVMSRLAVIISLIVVYLYTIHEDRIQPFAKWSDVLLDGKIQIVECSRDYTAELDKFEGCVPHRCKRVVNDKVLMEAEVETLLDIAVRGMQLGGSHGGASILDLHSGALSHGNHFINIYKTKEAKELFSYLHFKAFKVAKEKIRFAISHYFQVDPEKIYLTHPTFLSELTSKDPVTVHDEYWHPHVDKETYKSFHFTALIYLNDYGVDFEGGRFVFIDKGVNRTIEPRKRRVTMFTSGKENYHYVERVTKGVRYAMTVSFTCDKQYAIDDPDIRKLN